MIYKRYYFRWPTSLVGRILKARGLPLFLPFRLPHARLSLPLPTSFLKFLKTKLLKFLNF